MYSRSSEPVRFERDCAVVLVPQGDEVTLPAGSIGYITQALGGSYTVFVEGNLFRVAGKVTASPCGTRTTAQSRSKRTGSLLREYMRAF